MNLASSLYSSLSMDPLSIIANSIAVLSAAGGTVRGLERLYFLLGAPTELLMLMNEVHCPSVNLSFKSCCGVVVKGITCLRSHCSDNHPTA